MSRVDQARQPKGVPIGGQWATSARSEPTVVLPVEGVDGSLAAERHRQLLEAGYVPAVATPTSFDPRSTDGIDYWWGDHFLGAEYRDTGEGFPQMPDDYTPAGGTGNALSGKRRTHRVKYAGHDVAVRMPSATAIKRYAAESGEATFDVPVSAEYPDATGSPVRVSGWVRVTKGPGGRWDTKALGFPDTGQQTVGEAVGAVLEARRPSLALRDASDLIARHRARLAGRGTDLVPVHSAWIDAVGYDDQTGLMVTRTAAGGLYGHHVCKARFAAVADAPSPGAAFNKLVRGSDRAEVRSCDRCGRFYAATAPHTCPAPQLPEAGVVRNASAQAVARATMAAAANRTTRPMPPPPARTGEHHVPAGARTADVKGWFERALSMRESRTGMRGAPGWTRQVLPHLQAHTTETYVPWAYSAPGATAYDNGSTGVMHLAGVTSHVARQVGPRMTRHQLSVRQGEGPTAGAMLAAAARHPGTVELQGYAVAADRADERVVFDGLLVFDDTLSARDQVIEAARARYGLDAQTEPSEVGLVEVPWRPGEKAWRLWWN